MKSAFLSFFYPQKFNHYYSARPNLRIAAIIPSFKPGELTVRLAGDLVRWNKNLTLYVVDDSTPREYEAKHRVFERINALSDRAIVLRTPQNKLKAGAINHALDRLFASSKDELPDVILTLDDDVIVSEHTVNNLVKNLFEDDRLGAVCSQCRVVNKNKNLLTRLQGLEYLGFNNARLADEGFFWGPLVMHGMLTAFRTQALQETGWFTEGHLIEDYEITARLKSKKWHVRLAPYSYAWTKVPENFSSLWRQRTRWVVGGLFVLFELRCWRAVIQDVIGHTLFLSTFLFVIASFIFQGFSGSVPRIIPMLIISVSFAQALLWYLFQIWFMRFYLEKDWKDWLIRLSLVPEFIYANVLAIVVLGSYVFYAFQVVFSWAARKNGVLARVKIVIEKTFAFVGYSRGWGTRQK